MVQHIFNSREREVYKLRLRLGERRLIIQLIRNDEARVNDLIGHQVPFSDKMKHTAEKHHHKIVYNFFTGN